MEANQLSQTANSPASCTSTGTCDGAKHLMTVGGLTTFFGAPSSMSE